MRVGSFLAAIGVLGAIFSSVALAGFAPHRVALSLGDLNENRVRLHDASGRNCTVTRADVEKGGYALTPNEKVWAELTLTKGKGPACKVIAKSRMRKSLGTDGAR